MLESVDQVDCSTGLAISQLVASRIEGQLVKQLAVAAPRWSYAHASQVCAAGWDDGVCLGYVSDLPAGLPELTHQVAENPKRTRGISKAFAGLDS